MQTIESAKRILRQLGKNGHQAYLVGGCVRDILMGITPNDYDITTSALPDEVEALFSHTYPTGKKYGTILVMVDGCGYEVTTFRHDVEYIDGRRPECVTFSTTFKDDASRRDFTINAMAMNETGDVIDYFDGRGDLSRRLVKCVGRAEDRFKEDQLRKMRAIRFACQKDFDLDREIVEALRDDNDLSAVSIERYRDELIKILQSRSIVRGIKWLQEFKMLFEGWNIQRNELVESLSQLVKDKVVLLCALSIIVDRNIEEELNLSNATKKGIINLRQAFNSNFPTTMHEARVFLSNNPSVDLEKLDNLVKAFQNKESSRNMQLVKMVDREHVPLSIKDLAINGGDVKRLGFEGLEVREVLNRALDKVLEDPNLNDKNYLLEYIHKR